MDSACEVARLDRSESPEGYEVENDPLMGWGFQLQRMRAWPTVGTRPVREFHVIGDSEAKAIAAAWGHKQEHSDPPGLEIVQNTVGGRWYWGLVGECGIIGSAVEKALARAAAWAWYWDAVDLADVLMRPAASLAERMAVMPVPPIRAWPRPLTWSTDQRAAVRRWLAEGGELPEVLRG